MFADECELQAGKGGGERDKDKRPEQTQRFRHRHYQVRATSGFGRPTRPCAARSRLFRFINLQNGALRAPSPIAAHEMGIQKYFEKKRIVLARSE